CLASALVRERSKIGPIQIALSKVQGDLFECALFPFFRLREPEPLALGIERGAFAAQIFLTADLHESVHALTPAVRSQDRRHHVADWRAIDLTLSCAMMTLYAPRLDLQFVRT